MSVKFADVWLLASNISSRLAARNNELLDKQLNETLVVSYYMSTDNVFYNAGSNATFARFLNASVRLLNVHASVLN